MYKNIGTGESRSFAVTCGLAEGYGPDATTHTLEAAKAALHSWMAQRITAGLFFITGAVSPVEVVYAWPSGDGKAGLGAEPGFEFGGEVSVLYSAQIPDAEVASAISDLAAHLGAALGQTRVYAAYRDKTWVMEKEAASTPTGN